MTIETGHRSDRGTWHYGRVDHCRAFGCLDHYLHKLLTEDLHLWVPLQHRLRVVPGSPQERPDWTLAHPDLCGAWRAKWNQSVSPDAPRCELPPGHYAPNGMFLGADHLGRHPSSRWTAWEPFGSGGR